MSMKPEEIAALVAEAKSAVALHHENKGSAISGGWEQDAVRLARVADRLSDALAECAKASEEAKADLRLARDFGWAALDRARAARKGASDGE